MKKFSLKKNVCIAISKSFEISIRDSLYKSSVDLIELQIIESICKKTHNLFATLVRNQVWAYSRFNRKK